MHNNTIENLIPRDITLTALGDNIFDNCCVSSSICRISHNILVIKDASGKMIKILNEENNNELLINTYDNKEQEILVIWPEQNKVENLFKKNIDNTGSINLYNGSNLRTQIMIIMCDNNFYLIKKLNYFELVFVAVYIKSVDMSHTFIPLLPTGCNNLSWGNYKDIFLDLLSWTNKKIIINISHIQHIICLNIDQSDIINALIHNVSLTMFKYEKGYEYYPFINKNKLCFIDMKNDNLELTYMDIEIKNIKHVLNYSNINHQEIIITNNKNKNYILKIKKMDDT